MKRLFSLIELLVVIAIVLVLLSLIHPSLRRAIDLAMTTKCMAEIRNWSMMTLLYADDHNGYFMKEGFNDDWSYSWMALLKPYHGDQNVDIFCPVASDLSSSGHGNTNEAWDGPAFGHFTDAKNGDENKGSYGINLWLLKTENNRSWRNTQAEAERWQFHKLNNVNDPSNTPVFADMAWYGAEPHPNIHTEQGMPAPTRDFNLTSALANQFRYVMARTTMDRHQQGINVTLADGSAKNVYLEYLWNFQWTKEDWIFRDEVLIPWLH